MKLERAMWLAIAVMVAALVLWPGTSVDAPNERPAPDAPVDRADLPDRRVERLEDLDAPAEEPTAAPLHESTFIQERPQEELAWVEGTVFEADGRPAASSTVFIEGSDGEMTAAAVAASGSFKVAVPPGSVRLHAARWDGPVPVRSATEGADLRPGDTVQTSLELPAHYGGEPGLVAAEHAEGFEVSWVLPNSPALRLGLAAGDVILAVDGRPAAELSDAEFERALVGPEGSEVALLVRFEDDDGVWEEPIHVARSGLDGLWERSLEDSG